MALRLSPDQNWQQSIPVDAGTYSEGNVVKQGSAAGKVALITAKGDEAMVVPWLAIPPSLPRSDMFIRRSPHLWL
jgi:hypothetical protein